jgi:hypothetical protein
MVEFAPELEIIDTSKIWGKAITERSRSTDITDLNRSRTLEFGTALILPNYKRIIGFTQITHTFDLGQGWIHIPLNSTSEYYETIAAYNRYYANNITIAPDFSRRILGLPWKDSKKDGIFCSSVITHTPDGTTEICHIEVNLLTPLRGDRKYTNIQKMEKFAEIFRARTCITLEPMEIDFPTL